MLIVLRRLDGRVGRTIDEIENLDTSPGGSKNFTNVFAQYSGQDLVHAGWLKKETGLVFSVYQSRYVVLTRSDKMLRYFKKEDDNHSFFQIFFLTFPASIL